jgi:hypothetical protein
MSVFPVVNSTIRLRSGSPTITATNADGRPQNLIHVLHLNRKNRLCPVLFSINCIRRTGCPNVYVRQERSRDSRNGVLSARREMPVVGLIDGVRFYLTISPLP